MSTYTIRPAVSDEVEILWSIPRIGYRSSKALALKEAQRLADEHGVPFFVTTPSGRYTGGTRHPKAWLHETHPIFIASPDRISTLLGLGHTPAGALEIAKAEMLPVLQAEGLVPA